MTQSVVDLSCDLGEASTLKQQRAEEQLWPLITSANVACGGHTGDAESMRRAVDCAHRYSVTLGAHPSYPDPENFGRKTLPMSHSALRESLLEQIRQLQRIADERGLFLDHVKPHGALYNDAHHDRSLADVILDAVQTVGSHIAVVASSSSELFRAAVEANAPAVAEAFADRCYRADGSLVSRNEKGALLLDFHEAAAQAALLAEQGMVMTSEGRPTSVAFSTLCVHGDMPDAAERLRVIRVRLTEAGVAFSASARTSGGRA